MMKGKIGLTLSGGGVRGAAHVGLLQFLEENDIGIDIIAGTSAGAIVGALYAAGNSPQTILEVFKQVRLFDFSNFTWAKPGLLDSDRFAAIFEPYIKKDDFQDLQKELYIVACEVLKGEEVVFSEGPVIQAVLASSSFPGVFTPVKIEDNLYVDGGVVNNFPANLIREKCNFLIGMNVNPLNVIEEKHLTSTYGLMMRVMELTTRKKDTHKADLCDIYLAPQPLVEFNTFATTATEQIFEIGYETAKKQKDAFMQLLEKQNVKN